MGTSSDPERQVVQGLRYIDDLILRDRDTDADGTLDERLYAVQDANWNIATLTSASGAAQERYRYTPYGVASISSASFVVRANSIFNWEHFFTGRRLDNGTGLHDYRTRPYSAIFGLFLSRDLLLYTGGINLYSYVRNRPTLMNDPVGTDDHLFSVGIEEAWAAMVKQMRGVTKENVDEMRDLLNFGCVGNACLLIGYTDVEQAMNTVLLSNCYDKKAQAEKRGKEMQERGECDKKNNCYGKSTHGAYLLFAFRFWSGTENEAAKRFLNTPHDVTGKIDLSDYAGRKPTGSRPKRRRPALAPFDFGVLLGELPFFGDVWMHADHDHKPDDPMTLFLSTTAQFLTPQPNFDRVAYCVACIDWKFSFTLKE